MKPDDDALTLKKNRTRSQPDEEKYTNIYDGRTRGYQNGIEAVSGSNNPRQETAAPPPEASGLSWPQSPLRHDGLNDWNLLLLFVTAANTKASTATIATTISTTEASTKAVAVSSSFNHD
ncbi:hypothetical protein E6C27_scaffold190G00670 [Cucumis melo var. makuwa]|uniref:Uncharacterized protein n=1 Tax=Cucumis melo var. makuwa TaxID=1194695 RepID=A0A5A7UE92_CUCMM|nr:hypothetical protein E6C27_scaffold190G00670 [Cucumis melo var. makuwa]